MHSKWSFPNLLKILVFSSLLFLVCWNISITSSYAQQRGWYRVASPTTSSLLKVQFTSRDSGWIVGGKPLFTSDGGAHWEVRGPMINSIALSFISDTEGWIAERGSPKLFHTTDAGITWDTAILNHGDIYQTIYDMLYFSRDTAFIAADADAFSTYDSGKKWESWSPFAGGGISHVSTFFKKSAFMSGGQMTVPPLIPNHPTSIATLLLYCPFNNPGLWDMGDMYSYGSILVDTTIAIVSMSTKDRKEYSFLVEGYNLNGPVANYWSSVADGELTQHPLNSFCRASESSVYAVGNSPRVFRLLKDAHHWETMETGFQGNLNAVTFTDSVTGYAVGDSGAIYRTIDGGFDAVDYTPVASHVQVWPQPSTGITSLEYELATPTPISLHVFDLSGRTVFEQEEGMQPKGIHRKTIDLRALPIGVYRYTVSGLKRSGKLVIVR